VPRAPNPGNPNGGNPENLQPAALFSSTNQPRRRRSAGMSIIEEMNRMAEWTPERITDDVLANAGRHPVTRVAAAQQLLMMTESGQVYTIDGKGKAWPSGFHTGPGQAMDRVLDRTDGKAINRSLTLQLDAGPGEKFVALCGDRLGRLRAAARGDFAQAGHPALSSLPMIDVQPVEPQQVPPAATPAPPPSPNGGNGHTNGNGNGHRRLGG